MSKRMLVTFVIVSLAVLSASLFAACGGPASPQVEEPTVAPTPTPEEEDPHSGTNADAGGERAH